MKKYLVGGAVRDRLMGEEPRDFDYVIVGASVDVKTTMVAPWRRISQGYEVYQTQDGDEITFTSQSIEADVQRRDFTCNAVAYDTDSHELIDPLGGSSDIEHRIVRAVSYHNMKEDPVRALRGARMLAVLSCEDKHATLSPETQSWIAEFAQQAIEEEPSRAWQEIQKIMQEPYWYVAVQALEPYVSWLKLPWVSGVRTGNGSAPLSGVRTGNGSAPLSGVRTGNGSAPPGGINAIANPDYRSALCLSHVTDWTGYGGLKRWERLAMANQALHALDVLNTQDVWLFWKNHKNIADDIRELVRIQTMDPYIVWIYDKLYVDGAVKSIEKTVIQDLGYKGKAIAEEIERMGHQCIESQRLEYKKECINYEY